MTSDLREKTCGAAAERFVTQTLITWVRGVSESATCLHFICLLSSKQEPLLVSGGSRGSVGRGSGCFPRVLSGCETPRDRAVDVTLMNIAPVAPPSGTHAHRPVPHQLMTQSCCARLGTRGGNAGGAGKITPEPRRCQSSRERGECRGDAVMALASRWQQQQQEKWRWMHCKRHSQPRLLSSNIWRLQSNCGNRTLGLELQWDWLCRGSGGKLPSSPSVTWSTMCGYSTRVDAGGAVSC